MGETADIKRDALRQTVLFGALSGGDLDHVVAMTKLVHVPPQTRLFLKGDPGDRLYIVISGVVRIGTVSPDGQEITLNLMNAGQMFGEIAVLDGGDRTADAFTVDEVALLVIERRDLLAFLTHSPGACIQMLAGCTERLRWISELLEDACFLQLPARLAKRLLLLAQTFGQPCEKGVKIGIRLSQRDLASHMNVTRESINKVIKGWEQDGVIARDGTQLILVAPHRLEAVITANPGAVSPRTPARV